MTMKLSKILNSLHTIQVIGLIDDIEIDTITIDSREVIKKSLFIAIKGLKTDGHNFIPVVINHGAVAVILENNDLNIDQLLIKNNVVKILVKNSRKALAEVADIFYGSPSKKLNLIGITGTKGKTTTSFFIKNIFDNAQLKSGLIGTNKNIIGNKEVNTKFTTPEAHVINALLKSMVDENCKNCVMEVSSHSLEFGRVDNLDFDVAVFTNITSDHMDFHQNFENYLKSKKILFDKLKSTATAVINKDDANSTDLVKDTKANIISYSMQRSADIEIKNVDYSLNGTNFTINHLRNSYQINTKLIGIFNAYNAAAAFGASVSLGIPMEKIINGLCSMPQVPGRFEVLSGFNKKIIIDYSHTADSLKQALEAIKHIVKGSQKIYTVFGCGGDRDKLKRPIMGKIAEEFSDFVYVTSDNPRTEDPFEIINDITIGLKLNNHKIIENREEAIKTAIQNAEENSVILIAGKGHENYQEINGIRHHFSDKETAEKYL